MINYPTYPYLSSDEQVGLALIWLKNNYCVCPDMPVMDLTFESLNKMIINGDTSPVTENDEVVSEGIKEINPIKPRKRRARTGDITERLKTLAVELMNLSKIIEGYKSPRMKKSKRSSKYIGVSKNGMNWQSLINDGPSKVYIGTYKTEIEAAIAYDLYALALNGFTSKRNFSYSPELLIKMIEEYLSKPAKSHFVTTPYIKFVNNITF